jgi:hypothetical protein
MQSEPESRGCYVAQIVAGMQVRGWDGVWRTVQGEPSIDECRWITLRFIDGTAAAFHGTDVVVARGTSTPTNTTTRTEL